jgi:hypothetical protein
MGDDLFGGLAPAPWQVWVQEFVDGGPEELAQRAKKAGAPDKVIAEAWRIRGQKDADEANARWLQDEVGEVDRPEGAKVSRWRRTCPARRWVRPGQH